MRKAFNPFLLVLLLSIFSFACESSTAGEGGGTDSTQSDSASADTTAATNEERDLFEEIQDPGDKNDLGFAMEHLIGYLSPIQNVLYHMPGKAEAIAEHLELEDVGGGKFKMLRIIEKEEIETEFKMEDIGSNRMALIQKAESEATYDTIKAGKKPIYMKIFDMAVCNKLQRIPAKQCKNMGGASMQIEGYVMGKCVEGDQFCVEIKQLAYVITSFDKPDCEGKSVGTDYIYKYYCD